MSLCVVGCACASVSVYEVHLSSCLTFGHDTPTQRVITTQLDQCLVARVIMLLIKIKVHIGKWTELGWVKNRL